MAWITGTHGTRMDGRKGDLWTAAIAQAMQLLCRYSYQDMLRWPSDTDAHKQIAKLIPDKTDEPGPRQITNWMYRNRSKLESDLELKNGAAVENWVKGEFRHVQDFIKFPHLFDEESAEILFVACEVTEKSGIVISLTTVALLHSIGLLSKHVDRSAYFMCDTRYGQLNANLGLHTYGASLGTVDEKNLARNTFYHFLYSIISVEDKPTFRHVTTHKLALWSDCTKREATEFQAVVYGHDARQGQKAGIEEAHKERANLIKVKKPAVVLHSDDFFHKVKNVKTHVPKNFKDPGRKEAKLAKEITRDGDQWAGRISQWLWVIRLAFNDRFIQAFLEWKFDILAAASQMDLCWYLWNWVVLGGSDTRGKQTSVPDVHAVFPDFNVSVLRVIPGTGSGSAPVETFQRIFLTLYREVNELKMGKACSIIRFLQSKVKPVVQELLHLNRKILGVCAGFSLPKLPAWKDDDEIIEVELDKKFRKKVEICGKKIDVPTKYFLMWKNKELTVNALERANDEPADDKDEDAAKLQFDDLGKWWPKLQIFLFGSKVEIRKIVSEYKILKHISVVCFWEEMFVAWGISKAGHGGPCCISHCKDYGLHTVCDCVFRTLAFRFPEKYKPLYSPQPVGRPPKKVVEQRKRMEEQLRKQQQQQAPSMKRQKV